MRSLSDHFRKFNKNLDRFLEKKILVGLLFGVLIFGSKLPFVNLPFWWDEMNYIEGALEIYKNNLNPFIEWWSYKPPFIYELVALGYNLFGFGREIPRVIIIFFAFLAVYFTFLLGEKLYSKKTGFFASFLLFLSPLFFAQSGLFHADLPLTALALVTLYFFLSEKKVGYFIAASLMVLTKEAGVLVILAIVLYKVFTSRSVTRSIFLFCPAVFFFAWMVLNKLLLGWYLWHHNIHYFSSVSLEKLIPILDFAFWRDFRFLLSLPLLAGFILSLLRMDIRKWLIKKELALFWLLAIINIVFFWWGTFLPRYLLVIQPLFFIVGVAAIFGIFKKTILWLPVLAVISLLFVSGWFTPEFKWGGETNLNHFKAIRLHQEVAQFLENNFSSSKILTTWPMSSELEWQKLGYVNEPFDVIYFNSPLRIEEQMIAVFSKNNVGWQKEAKELEVFLEKSEVGEKPLAVFESGEEKISLYLLEP